MADARDFANRLFLAFGAINKECADAAQREYQSLTPEQRQTLWAERRAELTRIKPRGGSACDV